MSKVSMSKAEMLARIQAGAENHNQPELSPEMVEKIRRSLAERAANGWDVPIVQKAADPEAVANSRIEAAAPMMKPRPIQFGQPPKSQIPDSLEPGQNMPEMPENPSEDDVSRMNKLQYYQQLRQKQ